MNEELNYKKVMTEIISKQSVILGPEIAKMKARGVSGLVLSDEGVVTDVQGDPKTILQNLIDKYVELSGQIVRATLGSIFDKYPDIKQDM